VSDALAWLTAASAEREHDGLHRELAPRHGGPDPMLDVASNDYLGLARHPHVVSAAAAASRVYGAGATGSRLVSGSTDLHARLEDALALFTGAESALVFSSGYLANVGAVTTLSGPGTLIISDSSSHASLIDACRLSRARVVVLSVHELGALDAVLAGRDEERALVVTDAVTSVDGQSAPLLELHQIARRRGAALLVDEAHGLGVMREGAGACPPEIRGEPDLVRTVTLSKSLGSQGGSVVGSAAVRNHLIDTARTFIFDTALSPPAAAAALAALQLIAPSRVASVRRAARQLAALLDLEPTDGAIVRVPVGDHHRAVAMRDTCAALGVRVGCFRPPAVHADEACLRLTVRADLTDVEIRRAARVVRTAQRVHA
jgi:8-amino-7-oxononanoate synthase